MCLCLYQHLPHGRRRQAAGNEIGVFLFLCAGDALSSLKALRDAGRFVGKEDTVPLRLLYSRHSHSQITQDELSTRVKASSPGSTQVHRVVSAVRMERDGEGCLLEKCLEETSLPMFPACLCLH